LEGFFNKEFDNMKNRFLSFSTLGALLFAMLAFGAQTSGAQPALRATAALTAVTSGQATPVASAVATTANSGSSVCSPNGTVRIASDASYPPFENINAKTNQIEGFDVDLLNAIGKSQGLNLTFTNENFDTIFAKLAQGDYELIISAVTITDERQKTVDFSNPYFLSSQAIVVRKADIAKYKTTDDLKGLTIGVQKGTTGEDFATNNIQNTTVKSYTLAPAALQALANKDVEAVIIDTPVALNIIGDQPELNLVVAKGGLTDEKYGIVVRKECSALLNKVNAGLRAIAADGTYNKLFRQYFGEDAPADFLAAASAVGTKSATMSSTMAATMNSTMAATKGATMSMTMAATASK